MYKIQIKTKNIDEFRLWTHRYGIIFYVNENKKSSLSDWYPVRTFDGFFKYL